MAIEEQVRAYGGPQFQVLQQVVMRFAEAVEKAGIDVVPKVLIGGDRAGGSGAQGGYSLIESLIALILSEKAGVTVCEPSTDSSIANIRGSIRAQLEQKVEQA